MAEYEPSFGASGGNDGGFGGDNIDPFNSVAAPFLAGASASTDDSGATTSPDRDSAGSAFDPEQHIARDRLNADGTYRRKRVSGGRDAHSARPKRQKGANNQANIDGLTKVLFILHMGIAEATKTPEMALEEKEAVALASAGANVLDQFDIRPSPKTEAIIGMVMVAGSLYGPRAYMIRERWKKEAMAKASSGGNVHAFNPGFVAAE